MNKRVYIKKIIDINGDEITLMSEKELEDIGWEVKENKHNINVLVKKCITYDFLVREKDAKEDTLNLRTNG